MKTVVDKDLLKEKIIESSNLLYEVVGSTLGPMGNNVLINDDNLAPYITNDGVTIAKSISSDDTTINTILEIVKEASLKTNEVVGDGTTTTIVLLSSILKEAYESDKNDLLIKKDLENELDRILKYVDDLKKMPSRDDLIRVAQTSTNDNDLGLFIAKVFFKMKSASSINLSVGNGENNYYKINKGYSVDVQSNHSFLFQNIEEIELLNVKVLLLNCYLDNLEIVSNVINEVVVNKEKIVIIVSDCSDVVLDELISYKVQNDLDIYLFKVADYGLQTGEIMRDLSFLCGSKLINISYEQLDNDVLGKINRLVIKKDEIVIVNDNNISNYVKYLKKKLNGNLSEYEKDLLKLRLNKLTKGIATIYIGGYTKTEIKEKLMRAEDALNALNVSQKGIVVGEGITYLKLSDCTNNKILKEVFKKPFFKIMENANLNSENMYNEVKNNDFKIVYNFKNDSFESVVDTNIFDPVLVIKESIKNAFSIAGMLLTTNYLVVNNGDIKSFNDKEF